VDVAQLVRRKAVAALLEFGRAGSHAVLFAHKIGHPCIAGIDGIMGSVGLKMV